MLDRDHERELDRLLRDERGVGPALLRGHLVEQLVGERLQPRHLAAGRLARALLERVEARVRGDPVQPGAERGAALERLAPAPGAQERLLHQVLGLFERAEHPVAVDPQLVAMRLGGRGERGFVVGEAHGPL